MWYHVQYYIFLNKLFQYTAEVMLLLTVIILETVDFQMKFIFENNFTISTYFSAFSVNNTFHNKCMYIPFLHFSCLLLFLELPFTCFSSRTPRMFHCFTETQRKQVINISVNTFSVSYLLDDFRLSSFCNK